jgi:hypothetical protein
MRKGLGAHFKNCFNYIIHYRLITRNFSPDHFSFPWLVAAAKFAGAMAA